MPISAVHSRQIFDSRGNPTVEVEVTTGKGVFRAAVPSGASTGENEACELRDGGKDYLGKGVTKAVENVKSVIGPALLGKDPADQAGIDKVMLELDGTENKSKLGANAILGVSMACCRAGAAEKGLPLYRYINEIAGGPKMSMPVPCFNVINGGVHAGNYLAFQEFFLIPVGAASFAEAMKLGSETYHTLKGIIKKKYGLDSTAVGDEGGFAPAVQDPEEGLKLLMEAIDQAGYSGKILIGSDPASSEFWKGGEGKYDLDFKNPNPKPENKRSREEMVETYRRYCETYPIALLEDPFAEEDFEGHAQLTAQVGDKVEIVGDDLYCTNAKRVQMGLDRKATNAMLLKVNQIGSVTESIAAWKLRTPKPPAAVLQKAEAYQLKKDYPQDARQMLKNMVVATELARGTPDMEKIVKATRSEMSDFVAFYRRQPKVAGMPSFSTLYTAINTLSGHYASYGNKYPVPEKRKTRLQQQYKEIERALARGK